MCHSRVTCVEHFTLHHIIRYFILFTPIHDYNIYVIYYSHLLNENSKLKHQKAEIRLQNRELERKMLMEKVSKIPVVSYMPV